MLIAPYPTNEAARLELLRSLDILDTPAEEAFDRITRVLAELVQVPMALVSLVDANRQWFKSRVGLDACETPRDLAFCAHALHSDEPLIVRDASTDERFHDNPLVVGAPFLRFYVGIPLRSAEGLVLGTLCALDTRPRDIAPAKLEVMKDLARMVERELFQRRVANDTRVVFDEERRARTLSEARFATVFEETPTGKAIVHLDGRFEVANRKFCQIVGYDNAELAGRAFKEITHPEDIPRDMALVQALLDGKQASYTLEKRYIRKDGQVVWVDLSVSIVRDDAKQPLHFIAVVMDITARKQSEALMQDYRERLEHRVAERTADLVRSQETLQIIADSVPVLIAQIDGDLRYVFNNARYREIFNVDPLALRGRSVQSILPAALFDQLLPNFQRALAGERSTRDNVRYNPDDERIWRSTYIPDIRGGTVQGFFVMSQDVTEQKRNEKALTDKAMLDPLTTLPNRAALMERLEMAVHFACSGEGAFSLYFLDLDGFKQVNDEHGHEVGDKLLRQVAQRLRHDVREQDLVCRLGGDEFVLIAHGADATDTCERIASSLCMRLSEPFAMQGCTVNIGTSVGVVICPEYAQTTAEDVLAFADAAMYDAKRRGRNCYRFAPLAIPLQNGVRIKG